MNFKFTVTQVFILLMFVFNAISAEQSKVQIVLAHENKCINIPEAKTEEGVRLIVWNSNDFGLNQQWKLLKQDSSYIIQSVFNELVISEENGNPVQQIYTGDINQLWHIDSTDNGFIIKSNSSNKVLSINEKSENSHVLLLEEIDSVFNQFWLFEKAGIEFYNASFNDTLSVTEMHEDIEYFFLKLNEVHVNPYAFCSKDSVELRKQELLQNINKPLKHFEFNQQISALNGMFDGHTRIDYHDYNCYNTYKSGYGKLFPYDINYNNRKIYISSAIDSLKNLQIISINGISSSHISIELEKRINKEIRLMKEAEIAGMFSRLLFGIFNIKAPFEIHTYDTLNKVTKNILSEGLTIYQIPVKRTNNKEYAFRIYPKDFIAIIEHNTCKIENLDAFNRTIDSIFNIIKHEGIKHLFIDISRNGGGDSRKNHVFYMNIGHRSTPWYEHTKMKITLDSKMHACHYSLYFSNKSFEERYSDYQKLLESKKLSKYQKKVVAYENGKFRDFKSALYAINRYNNTYNNNIYIIQGMKTFSAGTEMSAWFKYGNVGTIIGNETGGTTAVYIESVYLKMPNSKILFRVSDKFSSYPNGKLNKGIKPDIKLSNDFYKEEYGLSDLKHFIERIETHK